MSQTRRLAAIMAGGRQTLSRFSVPLLFRPLNRTTVVVAAAEVSARRAGEGSGDVDIGAGSPGYLRAYDGVEESRQSIGRYIAFYNARRPHAALYGRTPDQAYSHPLPLRTAA
jgi:hypothetical protein